VRFGPEALVGEATTGHRDAGATIEVRGLSHEYPTALGPLPVLDEVDLSVPAGGRVSLTGRSGSGKSTLLTLLGGLRPVQRGTVEVDGVDVAGLDAEGLAAYRRRTVGFVFQHFGLLEALTAAENVELAGALSGTRPRQRKARAAELLEAVGLAERAGHRVHQLSGGERQRVGVARALFNRPRVLLADEPTGNLDGESSAAVLALLEGISASDRLTVVLVTHDPAVAGRAPRRYHLDGGRARSIPIP